MSQRLLRFGSNNENQSYYSFIITMKCDKNIGKQIVVFNYLIGIQV